MIEARDQRRGGVWLKEKRKREKKRMEESALVMPVQLVSRILKNLKLKPPHFAVLSQPQLSHINIELFHGAHRHTAHLWHCRNCVESSSCHPRTFERSS